MKRNFLFLSTLIKKFIIIIFKTNYIASCLFLKNINISFSCININFNFIFNNLRTTKQQSTEEKKNFFYFFFNPLCVKIIL